MNSDGAFQLTHCTRAGEQWVKIISEQKEPYYYILDAPGFFEVLIGSKYKKILN